MKKITWNLKNGKEARVEIELILKEKVWADGHTAKIDTAEIKVTAYAGKVVAGFGRPTAPTVAAKKAMPNAGGMIGKLVIPDVEMIKIKEAITELENHPAWIAKKEKEAVNKKEVKEYEKHRAKMKAVMGY